MSWEPHLPKYATSTVTVKNPSRMVVRWHDRIGNAKQLLKPDGVVGSIWEMVGTPAATWHEMHVKVYPDDFAPWGDMARHCPARLNLNGESVPCILGTGHKGQAHRSIALNATWS